MRSRMPSGILLRSSLLRLAWDELQLGRGAMARRALAQAAEQNANPIVVGWISQEIARQARAKT